MYNLCNHVSYWNDRCVFLGIKCTYYSPDVYRITWIYRPFNVLLLFLYLLGVYITNPLDAILAPLSILHNMQISFAIMQNSIFEYNSGKSWPNLTRKVTKPMFSGSSHATKAIRNRFGQRQYPHNMQISSPLCKDRFSSITQWQHGRISPIKQQNLYF